MNRLVLHGITAVAELKADRRTVPATSCEVLHGITAVAELKGIALPGPYQSGVVLHGITAVAELKGPGPAFRAGAVSAFSTASPPWPN